MEESSELMSTSINYPNKIKLSSSFQWFTPYLQLIYYGCSHHLRNKLKLLLISLKVHKKKDFLMIIVRKKLNQNKQLKRKNLDNSELQSVEQQKKPKTFLLDSINSEKIHSLIKWYPKSKNWTLINKFNEFSQKQ